MYSSSNSYALTWHEEKSSFLPLGLIDGLFCSIFNNTAISIALLNENGTIEIINETFCDFLGVTQEEVVGTSFLSYLAEEEENIHFINDKLKSNNYSVEKRFMRGDGEAVWGRLHFSLIKETKQHRSPYSIVICEDITALRTKENEIQVLQGIYQSMLDEVREVSISPAQLNDIHNFRDLGISLHTSVDERIVHARFLDLFCELIGACGAYYGYDENTESLFLRETKLLGMTKFESSQISKFTLGEIKGLVGWVAETRNTLYIPDVFAEPDWICIDAEPNIRSCYMIPVHYKTNFFGVITLFSSELDGFSHQQQVIADRIAYYISLALENTRFFTDTKQAFNKLHIIQKQLLQTQKMDAIGQLAGGMAHDLNNQMTIIQACIDLYKANPKNINLDSIFQKIRKAAEYSANLTRQLMFFSRKQPQFKTLININHNIVNLQNVLKYLISDNIEINLELDPYLWMIYADTNSINQVIINLVLNARDAMPDGGKITIKTANIEDDIIPPPDVQYSHSGNYICLSVMDMGLGIDEEMLNHLFEPFFTTKEVDKGIGMGLSVVYGITKSHEGWVSVVSKPGKGSTFNIYFPAVGQKTVK